MTEQLDSTNISDEKTFCGYVAIVGPPNAGKSTLMNTILGERLSIVTPKPHTTRTRVLGIASFRPYQVIFLDTPGILTPRYRLQEVMQQQITASVFDADAVIALFDYEKRDKHTIEETSEIASMGAGKTLFALNKMDLCNDDELDLSPYPEGTIPISALHEINMGILGDAIRDAMPPGPFLYPEDMLAEQPERLFVAELIRETIFEVMRQEIPYTSAVSIEQFVERDPKYYIQANIFVDRNSQKGMMIGGQGRTLKNIGSQARKKIDAFLDHPVYLELYVKVRPDWMKRDQDLKDLGYIDGE